MNNVNKIDDENTSVLEIFFSGKLVEMLHLVLDRERSVVEELPSPHTKINLTTSPLKIIKQNYCSLSC